MNPDAYTRPEKAAELSRLRRIRKRYEAAIEKRGLCFACEHRARGLTLWGRAVCKVGDQRVSPACERDELGPKFTFDPTVLEEFRDAQG